MSELDCVKPAMPESDGRPNSYRPIYCEMLVEAMENGSSLSQFARQIGVSYGVVRRWLTERVDFGKSHEFGRDLRRSYLDDLAMEIAEGSYAEYNAEGKQIGRKPSANMLQFIMRTSYPEVYNIQSTVKFENIGPTDASGMSEESLRLKLDEALRLMGEKGLRGTRDSVDLGDSRDLVEIASGS